MSLISYVNSIFNDDLNYFYWRGCRNIKGRIAKEQNARLLCIIYEVISLW